jgi:hypothetical protein
MDRLFPAGWVGGPGFSDVEITVKILKKFYVVGKLKVNSLPFRAIWRQIWIGWM